MLTLVFAVDNPSTFNGDGCGCGFIFYPSLRMFKHSLRFLTSRKQKITLLHFSQMRHTWFGKKYERKVYWIFDFIQTWLKHVPIFFSVRRDSFVVAVWELFKILKTDGSREKAITFPIRRGTYEFYFPNAFCSNYTLREVNHFRFEGRGRRDCPCKFHEG